MQLPEALRRAPVTGISVSEKKNMLRVELSPAAYIPMQILSALEKDLAGYTEGQQLAICCTYPPEAFCAEALEKNRLRITCRCLIQMVSKFLQAATH